MAIVWADVTAIAPELTEDAVALATRTKILAAVDRQVNASTWGDNADDGKMYLAAHLATISGQGGTGPSGGVAGESYGDVSIQYNAGTPPANASDYAATTYGREYYRLLRLNVARIGFVT